MSSSTLKRKGIQLQAMSKVVWKKLTKSTKLLHKFITHKSKKLIVINIKPKTKIRMMNNNITTPLYLSPRRTALKRKKLYKKYKFPPPKSPIYIDNLFKNTSYSSSSSSSSKLTMRIRDKIEHDHENVNNGNGLRESTLGIDERADVFIASFRAQLDNSFRKW
ncbi:hypothetical protein SOVF_045240 [Spinacia oleracea]|nr:hypothetical protein SOVF_045240 [Spinacia oleracea]